MQMKKDSSLGLDGFGPRFYSATWDVTSVVIQNFFSAFYDCNADLERINTSYVVLLPKKIRPGVLRTFSLFACKIALSKLLQKFFLIDYSPLSPVSLGAFRLVSFEIETLEKSCLCHRSFTLLFQAENPYPTIVLKIDFHKAFDSVNWMSLIQILKQRGFTQRWL